VWSRRRIGIPPASQTDLPFYHDGRHYRHVKHAEVRANGSFRLELACVAMLSVSGADTDTYKATVWESSASPWAADLERDSERDLVVTDEGVRIERQAAENSPIQHIDVTGPRSGAIIINASHAAVDVAGVHGPVKISTSHGTVWLADLRDTDVTAEEGGAIVWSGSQGVVRLHADIGIEMMISSDRYHGECEAVANGAISLHLPTHFESPFSVCVARDQLFDHQIRLTSHDIDTLPDGRTRHIFGLGRPVISLSSRSESITIDTTD
jgi:hypothetical protein